MEKDKLPKQCLGCKDFKVGNIDTPNYGKILCYNTCKYRKNHKKIGLEKWT